MHILVLGYHKFYGGHIQNVVIIALYFGVFGFTVQLLPPSLKICHLFPFLFVHKNLSPFTFTIFGNGPHIPLTHSHSHFIIQLIYKSRVHMPLTISTHFLLHFLKLVPDQMVTNYRGQGEYHLRRSDRHPNTKDN